MTETELAWLAGLLEGEGCFYLDASPSRLRRGARPAIGVTLQMTDEDVVRRAAHLMDSPSVYMEKRKTAAPNHLPSYRTGVYGAKAEWLMYILLPFMGNRRSERIRELLAMDNLSHHEGRPGHDVSSQPRDERGRFT